MNLYRTIRPEAIATAIRNADKAEAAGYSVIASEIVPEQYRVYRPKNSGFYVVQPTVGTLGKCECEQWNKEGYCKHLELTARYEAWVESVEYRAEEYSQMDDDRFFMEECQSEVLASVAGTWN